MKRAVLALALVLLPVASLAVPQYITMVGNYIITGTLTSNSLQGSVGHCVQIGTNGVLQAASSACGGGGGGVTSVTNTDGNLTVSPNTGDVIANLSLFPSVSNIQVTSLSPNTCVASNGASQLTSGGLCVDSVSAGTNITLTGPGFAPTINTVSAPTFSGVTDSALTPGECVQAGAAGLLTTTGASCGSSGPRTQSAQVTTSVTSPWEGTFTFGTPYSGTPICVATVFSSVPNAAVPNIVSESPTSVVIFDSSQTGATYNVQCSGS
jgi:hypothetical protein